MARGYTEPFIDIQLEKASLTSRMKSLQPHPQKPRTKWIPLVIKYHPTLNKPNKLCVVSLQDSQIATREKLKFNEHNY